MERYKYIITRDLVYIEKYRPVIKTSASPRFLYWSIFLDIHSVPCYNIYIYHSSISTSTNSRDP